MFKKNQTKSRIMLTKDKRTAIEEFLLYYVKLNPGKKIPNAHIAERYDTQPYNIGTITKMLVKMGDLKQISRSTYVINERPTSLPPVQAALPPQPAPENIAFQVEALAKDYMWQENGSGTLKGFIDWLKNV